MKLRSTLVLAVALAAGTAHAQAPAPDAAADAALSEGRRLYDLQEWDQAIAKFKEAYKLRADAPALFNIAQSYRLMGDCANAASFYKTFKRNFPKERNVDKFITEMEACAKSGTKPAVDPVKPDPVKPDPVKPDPVKPDPVKPDPVSTDPADTDPVVTAPDGGSVSQQLPPTSGGGGMKMAGLGVAGVGVLGLGASVFFGMRARSAASDAEALAQGSAWEPGIQKRGERADRNAKLFLVVGGAALVTGGVLYVLGAKKSKESSSVSFVPTADGASIAWIGDF